MPYRPRDICSAAFHNDIERLHLLVTDGVPGGYEDDETEELDEVDEAAIDADEEFVRFQQVYVNRAEEPDADDDDDEDELQEEEEEAQAKDVEQFRLIIRRKLRHRAIAAAINKPGALKAGTSPVTVTAYGVLFTGSEVAPPRPGHAADREAAAAAEGDEEAEAALRVYWKPSKRSTVPAYPLHWAVMGRAHEAVTFLVLNGADTSRCVGDSELHAGASSFPPGLTPAAIATANLSATTLEVLTQATVTFRAEAQAVEDEKQRICSRLEQLNARREKRRLEREQRRAQEEEDEERAGAEEDDEGEEEEEEDYE